MTLKLGEQVMGMSEAPHGVGPKSSEELNDLPQVKDVMVC